MGKKKGKDYRCTCGAEFDIEKQLILHCRKEHPKDPLLLYGMIGTVGDPYIDQMIQEFRDGRVVMAKTLAAAQETAITYRNKCDLMEFQFEQMRNAIESARLTLNNAATVTSHVTSTPK